MSLSLIVLVVLFIGAVLLAIGINTPAAVCSRVGSILLAIGFGLQLFTGMR
jgi:TRAP-type mannitol/chloroaromatic compound transport system permease large subunit